jgi:hypothetical protein
MKAISLFTLLSCLLISINLFGQTSSAIEADLRKLFKQIDYSSQDNSQANDIFGKKLKYYTEKYPSTIGQDFKLLKKEHLDISTSDDGLFRIYSWDTWTGGTMHYFESVFQYKTSGKTVAVLDTPWSDGDNRPLYDRVFTFRANNKTYYLATYLEVGSSKDAGGGIQIFAVEDNKLNDDVKLIKTKTGLHSQISCGYNFFSVVDWKVRPLITFNNLTNTIFIPLVDGNGNMTHKHLTYKFNGQYFERVKN